MSKTRLFIDMDGTASRFHDEVQYLERMFEEGFFRNLKPFDDVIMGFKTFAEENPDIELYILSTTIDGEPPYCKKEKNEWLDKYMPYISTENRIFVPQGESKAAFAYRQSGAIRDDTMILYDDYNRNLREWEAWDSNFKAVKCINNINNKGLGAYGGEKGHLWEGVSVNNSQNGNYLSFANCMRMAVESCEDRTILLAERFTADLKKADKSSFDYSVKERVCQYVNRVDPELSDSEYHNLLSLEDPLANIAQIIYNNSEYKEFGIEGIDIGGAIKYTAQKENLSNSNEKTKEIDNIIDDFLDLTEKNKIDR
ncbi:MAG: hypothetical protein IJ571_00155 [Ruminococcus sp.]|nr:hypothetical protein [Ruminococcus sp.]